MSKLLSFFKTLGGQVLLVTVIAVVTVFVYYTNSKSRQEAAVAPAMAALGPAPSSKSEVIQEYAPKMHTLEVPDINTQLGKKGDEPAPVPKEIQERYIAIPSPLTLFPVMSNGRDMTNKQQEETTSFIGAWLPSRRMIPCRLISALDSSEIETPLIAYIMEDVWNIDSNGVSHLVLPAGIVEVHGIAAKGHSRDRIASTGDFRLIWRSRDPESNGLELSVKAIVLNREHDPKSGQYGFADGSAGIKGELLETNTSKEIKLFAAAFLSGIGQTMLDRKDNLNFLSNELVSSTDQSLKNAAILGMDAVLQQYIQRIQSTLDEDGYYVAVRPGKQFYLYTLEPIDLRKAVKPVFENKPEPAPSAMATNTHDKNAGNTQYDLTQTKNQ